MSGTFTLKIEGTLDEIERIHTAVDIPAATDDWEPEFLFQIRLALEEIGINIVRYGYDEGREKDIWITLASKGQSLAMEIVDDGKPFDPFSDALPPDLDSSVVDRPIGGLGIHLVRRMMDEMHYQREDGRNKVFLIMRGKP